MNRRGFLRSLVAAAAAGAMPALPLGSAKAFTRFVEAADNAGPIQAMRQDGGGMFPIGAIVQWVPPSSQRQTDPISIISIIKASRTDWLPSYGQALSRHSYPELFAIIGHSFGGSGDIFHVPDLRGQFIRAAA